MKHETIFEMELNESEQKLQQTIEHKTINSFSEDYETFQREIMNDYIKFFLLTNHLKEHIFFEELLKVMINQKFESNAS